MNVERKRTMADALAGVRAPHQSLRAGQADRGARARIRTGRERDRQTRFERESARTESESARGDRRRGGRRHPLPGWQRFRAQAGAGDALRRRARSDRAGQRLERHPRARDAGLSAPGRRHRLFAARVRRVSAGDAGARRPRYRSAGARFGPRSRRDARRADAGNAHRLCRQSEQSDGNLAAAAEVPCVRRIGARAAC